MAKTLKQPVVVTIIVVVTVIVVVVVVVFQGFPGGSRQEMIPWQDLIPQQKLIPQQEEEHTGRKVETWPKPKTVSLTKWVEELLNKAITFFGRYILTVEGVFLLVKCAVYLLFNLFKNVKCENKRKTVQP